MLFTSGSRFQGDCRQCPFDILAGGLKFSFSSILFWVRSRSVSLTTRASALLHHVRRVILRRPCVQVIGSYARGIVASMTRKQAFGKWPIGAFIYKTISSARSSIPPKLAIAGRILARHPFPALPIWSLSLRHIHILPKAVSGSRGVATLPRTSLVRRGRIPKKHGPALEAVTLRFPLGMSCYFIVSQCVNLTARFALRLGSFVAVNNVRAVSILS
jgi:hypothetical protein